MAATPGQTGGSERLAPLVSFFASNRGPLDVNETYGCCYVMARYWTWSVPFIDVA